ncbi:hypothetical protein [Aliivibrio fischeri]|uniref:hypothetical protein n=1 Tax=Aliivibrio fischeri TaxID=668 RepID=UPI0012DAF4BC|nr:hypothetical protein [Aliivibrio fischeri]MUK70237.1 hypothetical protein [Aliivibrio fischeri]MUK72090.1 hypothetical protein [Aliivibrio fischeri]
MLEILTEILDVFKGNALLMGLSAFLGAIAVKRIETNESIKLKELLESKLSLLNANNEPVIHINREQAEFEFCRYREIWEAASEISDTMPSIERRIRRPEKLAISFEVLHELRCTLGALTNNAYPFIDNDVYNLSIECNKFIVRFMCLISIDERLKSTDELVKIDKREFDLISYGYDKNIKALAEAIRLRLLAMSLLQEKA